MIPIVYEPLEVLLTGRFFDQLCPPPKITASNVVKSYQSLAKPYINLAQAFQSGDIGSLDAEIDAGREIWSHVSRYVSRVVLHLIALLICYRITILD